MSKKTPQKIHKKTPLLPPLIKSFIDCIKNPKKVQYFSLKIFVKY